MAAKRAVVVVVKMAVGMALKRTVAGKTPFRKYSVNLQNFKTRLEEINIYLFHMSYNIWKRPSAK